MDVVTEVLEKAVGINWRTLAVLFVSFASSSQSFWPNDTSESWGDRTSKGDLFLDKHLGILSYSYWGSGFANETFPILVGEWIFVYAALVMIKGYLVFNIIQYCKDMFKLRYQTCHMPTQLSKLSHHHECRPTHHQCSICCSLHLKVPFHVLLGFASLHWQI